MSGGSKRSYILLKQSYSPKVQVCLSKYDLLLPPHMKVLSEIIFLKKTRACVVLTVFLICTDCEFGIMLLL